MDSEIVWTARVSYGHNDELGNGAKSVTRLERPKVCKKIDTLFYVFFHEHLETRVILKLERAFALAATT